MTYPEDEENASDMHKEVTVKNNNAVQHNQTASEQTLSPDEGHVLHKVRRSRYCGMAILPAGRTAAFDTGPSTLPAPPAVRMRI